MEKTLLELLDLYEVPHVIFEQPPLVLALCQVQFANVLNVANPGFVAPFQQAIQDTYPITEAAEQVQIGIATTIGNSNPFTQARSQQWRFTDEDNNWTVVLAQNFVTLETRAYEDFDTFLHRLRQILESLVQYIRPKFITRIGLRYIDEIRHAELGWQSLIRPELLGVLTHPSITSSVQLSMQEVILHFSGNRGINIHHGVIPEGTTVVPKESSISPEGPFYLLDFDVYREFRPDQKRSMNPNVICKHVAEYNKAIYQLFRWFVTDEYVSTLEVHHGRD